MTETRSNPWLHRFAVLTVVVTLALIGVGGLVTSHGAGMAVPDWPTSYGYNMFYFPIQQWVGGIFYEHTHRLLAAFVGLLTSILTMWVWVRETKGRSRWAGVATIVILVGMLGHRGHGQAEGGASGIPVHFKVLAAVLPVFLIFGVVQIIRFRGALRWLTLTAFFAVIFQGILGGLRVALYKDEIGIFHATLAQLFLSLLAVIALLTSTPWKRWVEQRLTFAITPTQQWLLAGATLLVLVQLVLGASMRHQHAGLAVPDFPLAYGQLWPRTDAAFIESINSKRLDVADYQPITAGHILLHMTHRLTALAILVVVGLAAWKVRRVALLNRIAWGWFALICVQAGLGMFTVLSNKAADVATLHVVTGAASLVTGALLTVISYKFSVEREKVLTHSPGSVLSAPAGEMAGSTSG